MIGRNPHSLQFEKAKLRWFSLSLIISNKKNVYNSRKSSYIKLLLSILVLLHIIGLCIDEKKKIPSKRWGFVTFFILNWANQKVVIEFERLWSNWEVGSTNLVNCCFAQLVNRCWRLIMMIRGPKTWWLNHKTRDQIEGVTEERALFTRLLIPHCRPCQTSHQTKTWCLSTGTGKLRIFGHLVLVFIWSCFVPCPLFLLFYVICTPVLIEGTKTVLILLTSNSLYYMYNNKIKSIWSSWKKYIKFFILSKKSSHKITQTRGKPTSPGIFSLTLSLKSRQFREDEFLNFF